MNIDLSVIIVNWNSLDFLKACLKSIYYFTKNINFEIIVIDNASFDGSAEFINENYPQIIFIQSKENIGFAKGNNIGFSRSIGRNVLILNPDTELIDNSLYKLTKYLDDHTEVGIVGCTLLNSDLSFQQSSIQFFPSIFSECIDIDQIEKIRINITLNEANLLDKNDPLKPYSIQVASGACLLVRRKVFEKAGGFSEIYFMYTEESDLCFKVKKNGYFVHFLNKIKIIHHGCKSTEKIRITHFKTLMLKESRFKFIIKYKGWLYAIFFRLILILISFLRLILGILFLPFIFIRSIRSFFIYYMGKWKTILFWGLGIQKAYKI